MNARLETLEKCGCDIKGSLPRFLDDEDFMLECIMQVLEDPSFQTLKLRLREENIKAAFEDAHTLKGIIANTGLSPLYSIVTQIVEPLRKGDCQGLLPLAELLDEKRQELQKAI